MANDPHEKITWTRKEFAVHLLNTYEQGRLDVLKVLKDSPNLKTVEDYQSLIEILFQQVESDAGPSTEGLI